MAFLPRHGVHHEYPPHLVPYRANVWAMHSLGVTSVFGPCASGSLQAGVVPGSFVVPDQLVDRTWGRPDSFFAWLGGDAAGPAGADAHGSPPVVSRLWYWVYGRRVDLQAVYPDVLGRDRGAFVGWTHDHGADEIHVSRAFLARRPA